MFYGYFCFGSGAACTCRTVGHQILYRLNSAPVLRQMAHELFKAGNRCHIKNYTNLFTYTTAACGRSFALGLALVLECSNITVITSLFTASHYTNYTLINQ